jgi:hypothetical protein
MKPLRETDARQQALDPRLLTLLRLSDLVDHVALSYRRATAELRQKILCIGQLMAVPTEAKTRYIRDATSSVWSQF